jgi:DegV family protein with EDD domain
MANNFETFRGEKVAIVHDSASSMPDAYRSGYAGLIEVPFQITSMLNGKTKTWVDNPFESDEQKEEFLYYLKNGQTTTSLPSAGDYLNTYKEIVNKGITEISVIPMSNHPTMSGSANSARFAAEELKNEANIVVFDSKTLSLGQGLLIAQADAENKDGKFNTADELVDRVEDLSHGVYLAQAFSDLNQLRKGGRIGLAANMIGGVFDVIPIINVNEEGELQPVAKKHGWKKAHRAIIEHVAEGIASHDPSGEIGNIAVRLALVSFESEHIEDLRTRVTERIPDETDSDEERKSKFKLATGSNGEKYDIMEFKENMVIAVHSGVGVDGFGALVIPEQSIEQL